MKVQPPLGSGTTKRLDRAAYELFKAAGRPDGLWADLTYHEREAWRECARRTIEAYNQEAA